jgi:acyl carrier protein
MPEITQEMRDQVKEIVYNFFAEECEVDRESINSETKVIEDLEGDSLMFLELLEIFKKKYSLTVGVESIGKYIMKHPAETVGKIVDLILLIIEHGEKISEIG